jgi:serine/threonine protein kinase/tetratricopeptide (TPR) repeat protein
MSKSSTTAPFKEIAQFELVRRLGAGGMAEVFLAKKRGAEGTYKLLVLKRILPTHGSSRRFRAMFIEEARLATRLNHPNVVQVYEFQDFGEDGLLLAMEYVEGCDLGHLMSRAKAKGARIPPWVGAWIIAEAAKGLHYAHEKKDEAGQPLEIVHRDVSPQNILLSFEGAVKIADFGIASARLFAEEQGVLKGKFGYMSPEQARGEAVDRRSDLYALGVVFWELLAGRPIHGGLGGEALLDIVRSGIIEPPTAVAPDVPSELEAIVLKALAPAREGRFATSREMAAEIGRAIVRQGELIDAAALEVALGGLVGQDARAVAKDDPDDSAALSMRSDDARTQAAVPLARSHAESRSGGRSDAPLGDPDGAVPAASSRRQTNVDARREVRHVAVVNLQLQGLGAASVPRRMLDRLRGMLDDLAFKRGMRWIWSSEADSALQPASMSANAIAGIAANPSRAANDAAQLALDVHETIAGFKEDLPTPVAASIGIARGIASGIRDAQGHLIQYVLHDPVAYLAGVLGRSAPVGRTWVAGGVYRLVRRDFRWGDVPTVKLESGDNRDVPPTMRVYALERSLSREERLDVQGTAADLVGRDAEKGELHAAFHEAVAGRGGFGQLVCRAIVGEMGIGKTALVATFLAELPPNARLLHVECSPVAMEVPYAAVADMVRQALGTAGEEPFEQVATLIAKAAGGVSGADVSSPVVARLAELATNRQMSGGSDEDAHARRKQIVAGVRNLLDVIAAAQPLVLVVESMHWSDKASLDVIGEIAHATDQAPIFVLLVARPEERIAHATDGLMRLELRGLTPDEQVRLVETRLGVRDGARQVCADLLPKVGGNPFFLLEMIDALLERGSLEIREKPGPGEETISMLARTARDDAGFAALPSTLEQLLGDRIRELPLAEHAVVDWLAIAGGPLPVADVIKLSASGQDEAIVRLCARGVCDRKGELVDFRHPITREVAYSALDSEERARMHRAMGEHLAKTSVARGLSAAIVARHFARGHRYDRAAHFFFEAGAAARASYQTRLAIRYYLRATSYIGPDDKRRIVAHEALENAYRMLGRRRERLRHLKALRQAAKRAGTSRAACLGLLRTARYEFDEGRLPRGLAMAQQVAQIAKQSKLPEVEMEAEARVSEFLRELGDVQGALAACDRALIAFDPAHHEAIPPRQRGEVLRLRGMLLLRVGRVREAVDAYVDSIAIFRKCGARRLEARAKGALSSSMFVQGRYEDAIALSLESIKLDLSIGVRFQIARALTSVGNAYFCLGDIQRARAYLTRARQVHERYGDQHGWAETLLVSALVATELGELEAAEGFVRDAGALTAVTENAYDRTHEKVIRALLERAKGEPREAVTYAVEARREAEKMALVAFHFYAMAIEAGARVEFGEVHAAMLLATTALGAVENLQGCEYGLEIRILCAEALKRAGSPDALHAWRKAADHSTALAATIRDARLRKLFAERPINARLSESIGALFSARGGVTETAPTSFLTPSTDSDRSGGELPSAGTAPLGESSVSPPRS